jgi:hypothetical protein
MVQVAWIPGWYELDPCLEVGLKDEFAFWRVVPEHLRGSEELVLYNDLSNPGEPIFAIGRITSIRHPDLGGIRKVDTHGLDYTITLADGTEIVVNAEEDPGKMFEGKPGAWVESRRVVLKWRFAVEFESLSDFTPEPQRKRRRTRRCT